jgi:prevent-host-death family protein
MVSRLPEIRPITDLARDARGLVERARQRQEPIIITQRGRDAAVLVPIELYRRLERLLAPRIVSPRLARPEDVEQFRMEMSTLEPERETPDAGL